MKHLNQLNCQYDGKFDQALKFDEIQQYFEQLNDWVYASESGHIKKTFKFKNFYHTMNFVNALAWIANREAHHPDLQVSYSSCEVIFTTHDAGHTVTMNDLICAAKVDQLTEMGTFGPQVVDN